MDATAPASATAPAATPDILVPLDPAQRAITESWFERQPSPTMASWERMHARASDDPDLACLQLYLPLLLAAHHAAREGRLFVFAHVAQTLDARIACTNGHSQWISNQANLHHAHRVRALLDAVMVGGNTALADDPQLSVRHVSGPDPQRIVLSGRAGLLRSEKELQLFQAPGCTVICSDTHRPAVDRAHVDVLALPSPNGRLEPKAVRVALAERGVHSLFLEGGGSTLSAFLHADQIDLLHIHIAPIILGSGIRSFSLPEVDSIQAGLRFETEHFVLDSELLVVARRSDASTPTGGRR